MAHIENRTPYLAPPNKLSVYVTKAMMVSSLAGVLTVASANAETDSLSQSTESSAAMSEVKNYSISSGSLESVLNQLGQTAGILLSFSSALTEGKQSGGLQGSYTIDLALAEILKDSGLEATKQENGSYSLIEVAKITEYELDNVLVRGTVLSRYEYDEAVSATGFESDVDALPRSVQVIPEQLILDQNSERVTDVLVNAASVTRSDGFGGAQDEVFIRGMDNNHLFIDGSPVSNRTRVDVAMVERVEVVNGPASVLHGQVSPGGLINVITKQPQKESAHSIQASLDDGGRKKLTLDSTGSISDDFQYRIVVSGEDSESFREVKTAEGTEKAKTESLTVAPSLSYTPDDKNTFTLNLGYSDKTVPIDRGAVAIKDESGKISIADIPTERRLGSEFSERESTEKRAQFGFDHEFDNGWTNRFKVSYFEKEFDDYQARPTFGLDGAPSNLLEVIQLRNTQSVQSNGLLVRTADSNMDVTEDDLYLSNSISGDFNIGNIENKLYVGANYTERGHKQKNGIALQDITGVLSADTLFALDLNIIDINQETRPAYAKRPQSLLSDLDNTYTEYGLSIQNLSYLTHDLTLLTGLRYDHFELDSKVDLYYSDGPFAGTYVPQATAEKRKLNSSNENVSGQLGLLYQINNEVSVYGSYSESFLPNYPDVAAGPTASNEDLDPEEAEQYELGLKSSMMDDKLRIMAAVYQLTRENVWSVDNNFVSHLNGKEETQGAELTATMQFIPGLNVLASYTYLEAEIVNDNNEKLDNEGNTPKSVPNNKGRAWGSYEVQEGQLAGLGFGLGAEYVGEREGDDENSFNLPAYTLFDTAAWYYIPVAKDSKLRLQAGVKNLTDEEHYTASINAFRINVGEPRTAYLSARLEF